MLEPHRPRRPCWPYAVHVAGGTAAGVTLSSWAGLPAASVLVACSILAALSLARLVVCNRRRCGAPLAWLGVGLALGGFRALAVSDVPSRPSDLAVVVPDWPLAVEVRLTGCIRTGARRTRGGWEAVLSVEHVSARGDERRPVTGNVLLRWPAAHHAIRPPLTGDCLDLAGSLTGRAVSFQPWGFDAAARDARRAVAGTLWIDPGSWHTRAEHATSARLAAPVMRTIDRARLEAEARVLARAPPRAAGWLLAIGTGSRFALGQDDHDQLARSGMAHLLAVSGLHVGIFAMGFRWLAVTCLGRSRRLLGHLDRPQLAALLTVPMGWLYAVLTGLGPAVFRAAVFVTCWAAAALLHRKSSLSGSAGAAVTAILLIHPLELGSAGFQLSLAAVIGIAVATRASTNGKPRSGSGTIDRLVRLSRASLGATLTTAPLLAHHFGTVSISGLVHNVLVAPLLALLLVPVALMTVLSALLLPVAVGPLGSAAELLVTLSVAASEPLAQLLGDPQVVGRPGAIEQLSVWGFLLALAAAIQVSRIRRRALSQAAALAVVVVLATLVRLWPGPSLEVWFLPVGQGDASLIRLSSGHTILVDAGGDPRGADPGRTTILPMLRGLGVGALDLVVISHADTDHVSGLAAVVAEVPPRELWWGGPSPERPELSRLVEGLRSNGTRVRNVRAEPTRRMYGLGRATLEVLHPPPQWRVSHELLSENDGSVCLRVADRGRSILFLGDVEQTGEALLVARHGPHLRTDVLKVPHHGSRSSSSYALLTHTLPIWAVFSVGVENRFGFPHDDVLGRYRALGIGVLRTDQNGLVRLRLDPRGIQVTTFGPRGPG